MAGTCSHPGHLQGQAMDKIHSLEQEIGTHVMALESGCQWSTLDQDKLQKLQSAERELGVILLAYDE